MTSQRLKVAEQLQENENYKVHVASRLYFSLHSYFSAQADLTLKESPRGSTVGMLPCRLSAGYSCSADCRQASDADCRQASGADCRRAASRQQGVFSWGLVGVMISTNDHGNVGLAVAVLT